MGEEVYTCRHCKKLFTSVIKRQVCEECDKKEDQLFQQIKEYLRQYPNSNAMQIAEGLEINVMSVLHFIDEGRLSVVTGGFSKLKEPRRQVIRRTTRAENSQLEPEHEIELGNEEEE